MRAHTNVDEAAPICWILAETLPDALRCEVEVDLTLQPLRAATSRRVGAFTQWALGAVLGLAMAADHAIDLAASGAGVPAWVAPLCAAVAVALSLWIVGLAARRRRYGPRRSGDAGALLSTTTLVLVEHPDVAVVPLEHATRDGDVIAYQGQRFDVLDADAAWRAAFDSGVLRARRDLDARLDDPWRGLRARPATQARPRAIGATLVAVAIVACGVAICRPRGAATETTAAREGLAPAAPQRDAAAERLAQDAQERSRYIAARDGTEASMRDYLRAPASDLARWRDITRRLRARCDARLPFEGVAEDLRFYRALQRRRCASPEYAVNYRSDVELVAPEYGGPQSEVAVDRRVTETLLRERLASVFGRLGDREPLQLRYAPGGVYLFLRFHAERFYFLHRDPQLPTEEQLDLDESAPPFRPRVFRYTMPWRETPIAGHLLTSMPYVVSGT